MRIVSSLLFLFIGLIGLSACMNQHAGTNADAVNTAKLTARNVVGVYKGDLPCTDCEAIATVLTLSEDAEYVLEYLYVGKSAEAFSKTGTWKLTGEELKLSDLDYLFKVEDKRLRQLDLSGKEITGELAERYVLKLLK